MDKEDRCLACWRGSIEKKRTFLTSHDSGILMWYIRCTTGGKRVTHVMKVVIGCRCLHGWHFGDGAHELWSCDAQCTRQENRSYSILASPCSWRNAADCPGHALFSWNGCFSSPSQVRQRAVQRWKCGSLTCPSGWCSCQAGWIWLSKVGKWCVQETGRVMLGIYLV